MSPASYFVGILSISGVSALIVPKQYPALNFQFPKPSTQSEIKPFQISVNKNFVKETIQKASLYRPSIALEDETATNWEDGAPPDEINKLANYWAHEYNWFDIENQINANFSHFTTTLPGSGKYPHPIPVHFIHERASEGQGEAIPLLLLHGWPSTHLEWSNVVRPLAHPSNKSSPRFNVVAPDLPGFGFSPAAIYSGLGPREMGHAFDVLMHQLGYSRYAVFSTDLGWRVGMWMTQDTSSIIAHATDFFLVAPNSTDLERFARNETTTEESIFIRSLTAFRTEDFGYAGVHDTKPLALAFALSDSPVGFAGWVWQLMATLSDGYNYSKEELVTSAFMLWIQGVYGNIRAYKEFGNVRHPFDPQWS